MFAATKDPFTEEEFNQFLQYMQTTPKDDLIRRFIVALVNDRDELIKRSLESRKTTKR